MIKNIKKVRLLSCFVQTILLCDIKLYIHAVHFFLKLLRYFHTNFYLPLYMLPQDVSFIYSRLIIWRVQYPRLCIGEWKGVKWITNWNEFEKKRSWTSFRKYLVFAWKNHENMSRSPIRYSKAGPHIYQGGELTTRQQRFALLFQCPKDHYRV